MSNSSAARLIRLRNKLGFTQRELAKEFQVSPGAVGFWESGGRVIPGSILKLMEAYEFHLEPNPQHLPKAELTKLCTDWSDKLLASIPTKKKRPQIITLKSALKDLFQRYLTRHLSHDPIKRSVQIATYSRLVGQFNKTKGLPLKVIQLASYLDADMPPELRECLHFLQGAITGMPEGTAAKIIFEEFGKRPTELFAEWSPKPFAAASLGQVHQARLHTGEWVAVKIQYPGIREDLEAAFKNPALQEMLATLIKTGDAEVLEDFKKKVLEECDYLKEAETQKKFGIFFKNDPSIYIPQVFPKFSSKKVITSEFIDGIDFHQFAKTADQKTRNWAGETMVRFQGQAFFWHDTLYADIHPGNLLFRPNQMIFLDFGRVLSCEDRKFNLLGDLLKSVLADDAIKGRKIVEAIGMISDWNGFEFDEFWQLLREQHCHFWKDAPFEFNQGYLMRKGQLMRSFTQKNSIRLTGPAFWNFFAVSTHDAIRAELLAKANWRALILKAMNGRKEPPRPKSAL